VNWELLLGLEAYIYIWVVIVIFKYVKMSFGKGEDAIFERK
jgi:hypothetical protein